MMMVMTMMMLLVMLTVTVMMLMLMINGLIDGFTPPRGGRHPPKETIDLLCLRLKNKFS